MGRLSPKVSPFVAVLLAMTRYCYSVCLVQGINPADPANPFAPLSEMVAEAVPDVLRSSAVGAVGVAVAQYLYAWSPMRTVRGSPYEVSVFAPVPAILI